MIGLVITYKYKNTAARIVLLLYAVKTVEGDSGLWDFSLNAGQTNKENHNRVIIIYMILHDMNE